MSHGQYVKMLGWATTEKTELRTGTTHKDNKT